MIAIFPENISVFARKVNGYNHVESRDRWEEDDTTLHSFDASAETMFNCIPTGSDALRNP